MAAKENAANLFGEICTSNGTPAETPELTDQRDPAGPEWSVLIGTSPEDTQWQSRFGSLFSWDTVDSRIKQREARRFEHKDQYLKNENPWQPPEPRKRFVNGREDYYEYVPVWCDPEYVSVENQKARDKSSFIGRQVPGRGNVSQFCAPTSFAKRYGVFPGRFDGRSLLSPLPPDFTKVKLANDKFFEHGKKKIDVVDKEVFHMVRQSLFEPELAKKGDKAGNGDKDMMLFIDFLKENSVTVTPGLGKGKQDFPPELFYACLEHYQRLAEERDVKDYQRYMFSGYDVDELINKGLFNFNDDASSELPDEPLNMLLKRQRWTTLDPIAAPIDRPRQVWRIFAKDDEYSDGLFYDAIDGEWVASDDRVWNVLQPALRLVSRILNVDPPAWRGLRDLYSRFPIDPSRDPWDEHLKCETYLSAFKDRVGWEAIPTDNRPRFENLAALHATGIDLGAGVLAILDKCLKLSIGSCHRGKREPPSQRDPAHGLTYIQESGQTIGDVEIRMIIGAEIMWPLISLETTESEKLSCSFAVACALLHELGHAVELACSLLTKFPDVIPDLTMDQITHLTALSDTLFGEHFLYGPQFQPIAGWTRHDFNQPFLEDEPVAEPGHAVVNDIFGGTVNRIQPHLNAPMPESLNLTMTALVKEQWPPPKSRPWLRNTEINPILLKFPSLPISDINLALPFKSYSKYFQTSFWEKDFGKFGYEAMKLHNEGDITQKDEGIWKPAVDPGPMEEVLLARTFGTHRGSFIHRGLNMLDKYGYHDIVQHLKVVLRLRVWELYSERRWHFERRTWPQLRIEMDEFAMELQAAGFQFIADFDTAQGSADEENHPRAEALLQCTASYNRLAGKLRQMERLCSNRLCYFQLLAREYLTHGPDMRKKLEEKHGSQLRGEIQCGVVFPCKKTALALGALAKHVKSHDPIDNVSADEIEGWVGRVNCLAKLLEVTKGVFVKGKMKLKATDWHLTTLNNMGPDTILDAGRVAALMDCERLRDPYVILIVDELSDMIGESAGLTFGDLHKDDLKTARRELRTKDLKSVVKTTPSATDSAPKAKDQPPSAPNDSPPAASDGPSLVATNDQSPAAADNTSPVADDDDDHSMVAADDPPSAANDDSMDLDE